MPANSTLAKKGALNTRPDEAGSIPNDTGSRIIVALDFDNADSTTSLLDRLDPQLCRVKIGNQLFTTAGPALVKNCQDRGFDVFLDLKFHDIPNTVAGACRAAAELGVWMVNVHACGGLRMLTAAREAVGTDTLLIAVTVLTSMTTEDMTQTGLSQGVENQVDQLASLSHEAGLDGVVCSPRESSRLRSLLGPDFKLVTPGVRPIGSDAADQRRVATPSEAVKAGSDFLVIGRPVTGAADPVAALSAIHQELDQT